ncbi:MAG: hypothetical protein JO291_06505 [Acidimicrobiia bacterium]|nr:hypothetical protein [Acidimicrobiia bacterium]
MPTTTGRPATEIADFIGGFVAAEGTFVARPWDGQFAFAVALGATDRESVEMLHRFFRCGRVTWRERRQAHFDDEVTFVVRKLRDLVEVVVPFMDEHLHGSYKRQQYLAWRAELLEYWEHGVRRRRPCTVEGCRVIQRAKGLCRHHYYERFGR